jgi:hypothetical protein
MIRPLSSARINIDLASARNILERCNAGAAAAMIVALLAL